MIEWFENVRIHWLTDVWLVAWILLHKITSLIEQIACFLALRLQARVIKL